MERTGRYAICGQYLWTGMEDTCRDAMAVIVNGEIIEDIVPRRSLPGEMPVEAYPGCTIMPGLIDCHGHVEDWALPLYLQHGVTTVRDTGNEPRYILDRRERMRRPQATGPHILCCGPALDGWPYIHENICWAIRTPDDIEAAIVLLAEMGVDGIKLYANLGAERAARAVAVCRGMGLHVTSHFEGGLRALDAVRLGVNEIQHLHQVPDQYNQNVVDEIVRSGTWVCPTQSLWEASSIYRGDPARKTIFDRIPFGNIRIHSLEFMQNEQACDPTYEKKRRFCENQRSYIRALVKAGGRIVAGSDTPCQMSLPGISLIDEVVIFTQCGMSNTQALAAATSVPSRLLRVKAGALRKGYRADALAAVGNPIENIQDLYRVEAVYKAGCRHLPAEIAKMDLSLHVGGCMPLIHRVATTCEDWKERYLRA